ncbi:MAG: alpha-E domain-containing protein [Paracoccaceae bacterium]|nr:alpha-E domain-containing protein [Paracoccaceae bacterium]
MLSRHADHLFWMTRYIERAETTARLLEVGARNALLPDISGGFRNDWDAVLQASGSVDAFLQKYGDVVQRNVETHLFFDQDNPSSVMSCLSAARENARVVRTALTASVWDAINTSYQELRQFQRTERSKFQLTDLTEWTRRTAYLVRGAITGTQLRDDGYHFMGLGASIERADNTARLIDVKYYVLLPSVSYVGSGLDQSQWATLLRSMSALGAYNWTYSGDITASKIADLLILNRKFPRSLVTSVEQSCEHLDSLARGYGSSTDAQAAARGLYAELADAQVQDIFEEGLHDFLGRMQSLNADMAQKVQAAYLQGLPA